MLWPTKWRHDMKIIILILALTLSLSTLAKDMREGINLNCYERLEARRGYQRSVFIYRIISLGWIGSINRQRIKGTRRTFRILAKAYECEYNCENYGYTFNKFRSRLEKRIGYSISNEDLRDALIIASNDKMICPKDGAVARRHYNYNELLEYMSLEF